MILNWFHLSKESYVSQIYPDSKIHGANVGPTFGRQERGGPHVGHTNLAIWVYLIYWFAPNDEEKLSMTTKSTGQYTCTYIARHTGSSTVFLETLVIVAPQLLRPQPFSIVSFHMKIDKTCQSWTIRLLEVNVSLFAHAIATVCLGAWLVDVLEHETVYLRIWIFIPLNNTDNGSCQCCMYSVGNWSHCTRHWNKHVR